MGGKNEARESELQPPLALPHPQLAISIVVVPQASGSAAKTGRKQKVVIQQGQLPADGTEPGLGSFR